jgi:pyridoxal phosphate-dependent aminotransferase EpsN
LTSRDLVKALDDESIEARPVWRPMHTQPVFADAEVIGGTVAESLYAAGVCIPSSSSLAVEQQDRVVEAVRTKLETRVVSRIRGAPARARRLRSL